MAELKKEVKSLDELPDQATERGYVTADDVLSAVKKATLILRAGRRHDQVKR